MKNIPPKEDLVLQLQYQKSLLETLFELAPVGIALNDFETGAFIDVNNKILESSGYTKEEFLNLSFWDITPVEYKPLELDAIKSLKQHGKYTKFQKEYIAKDGSRYPVCLEGVLVTDIHGKLLIWSVVEDISEPLKKEKELIDSKTRIKNILEGTHVGTWEWNVQTGETIFNQRWAEIVGYTLEELSPIDINTWVKLTHPDDLAESNKRLEDCFNQKIEFYECEARMKHKDGHWVWVFDRGKVFSWTDDGKPLMMFGTHQEITHQKNYEKELIRLSSTDPLTGLNNRRVFMESLNKEWHRCMRHNDTTGVLILDLDHFKHINDNYGHSTGDDLLRHMALLMTKLRANDLVARIGGEEFAIILPNTNYNDAVIIAERIRESISQYEIVHEDKIIKITTSIGVALLTKETIPPEKALHHADKALYKAKSLGRNKVVKY